MKGNKVPTNVSFGYPNPERLLPELKKLGLDVQVIETRNYSSAQPYREISKQINSQKILWEWEYFAKTHDFNQIFNLKKDLFLIPHHEVKDFTGCEASILKNSVTILSFEESKRLWSSLCPAEASKIEVIRTPTRLGRELDKSDSKMHLGIKTKYSIICWGFYFDKGYDKIIPWLEQWHDVSLLFCGSSSYDLKGDFKSKCEQEARKLKVGERVFFSEEGISLEKSDDWFSAADLCTCPRTTFGISTAIDVIGHSKCFITPSVSGPYSAYLKEISNLSGIVVSANIQETTKELLNDEAKRKVYELLSGKYARENSFEEYAKKLVKIMEKQK